MEAIFICAACMDKRDIHYSERSLDHTEECYVCHVPDKCLSFPKSSFIIMEADYDQKLRSAEANAGKTD